MAIAIFIVLVLILFNIPKSESSADMQERFWLKADREQWRKERRERRRQRWSRWFS